MSSPIPLPRSILPTRVMCCAAFLTHLYQPYKTYNYATFACPVNVVLQPGGQFSKLEKQDTQVLSIKWQPRPGPDTSATTSLQVSLQAELIGPFSSLGAFQQVIQPDGSTKYLPVIPVVAVAPTIRTTNWTNQTYTSSIQFPQKLASGYYQVLEMLDISDNSDGMHGTGRCIIQV